ncbi:MAG TPA: hypothetical protein PLQ04_05010 [Lachnospiraceae bacterium]|nr:hypothetical protein [Lachnospiraceae bacterium]
MEAWLECMKTARIFLTIAELILHLVPNAEYEKYVRYLLDLCVVIVLFWPLVNSESREELLQSINKMAEYKSVWSEASEELTVDYLNLQEPERVSEIILTYEKALQPEGSVSDGKVLEETMGE